MRRESHVRFSEGGGVKLPSATRRNVYVRSEKAGHRVMASLTRFIEGRLKLQVNAQKSAVARPWQRSFLGFTVTDDPQPRRRIARVVIAGRLDPETLALRCLGPVEDARQTLPGTSSPQGA